MADPKVCITIGGETLNVRPGSTMTVGGEGMPVPDHVFIHEAGHAVVAHAFGWRVVCIEPAGDGYRTGFETPENPTPTEHFLLAVVSLAGGAAQQRAGVDHDCDDGCAEDRDLAIGSVLAYIGEDPDAFVGCGESGLPAEMEPALRRAVALALDIVKARWPTVEWIAAALREAGRLDAEALERILEGDS